MREEFAARRFATARVRLARLAERRPGDGEVELLLGDCERMLGHPDAALAAWGRIPEGAAQAPPAALSSGRMAMGLGRYRLAEDLPPPRQPGERRRRRRGVAPPRGALLDDGPAR